MTTLHARIQKLRQLPPGRAHQAASNVARVAFPLGYHPLAPFIDAARGAARRYVTLRSQRFGERQARGDGAAARIDRQADVRVGFIHDTLRRYAADLPDTDEGRTAAHMLRTCFPRGLAAVVKAPYEEELIQLEAIVDLLVGEHAEACDRLAIAHHVAALRPLVEQYAVALDREEKVTPQLLRQAWLDVHHGVLELAFAVVVQVRDPDHRARVLAPIFEQDDRLAALYAGRARGRAVDDLDLDAEVTGPDGQVDGDEADGDDLDLGLDDADADRAPAGADPLAPLPRDDG